MLKAATIRRHTSSTSTASAEPSTVRATNSYCTSAAPTTTKNNMNDDHKSPWQELWNKLLNCFWWLLSLARASAQRVNSGPAIVLDTGKRVRLGKLIAEGGFSFVFEATEDLSHSNNSSNNNSSNQRPASSSSLTPKQYALKQIRCPEPSMLAACRQEAGVHRSAHGHPNLLPLLGFTVTENVAYMLFPKMNRSLRQEINHRILDAPGDVYNVTRPPWNEVDVLNLFVGMARGVQALHTSTQLSHRDIKVENVMFEHANSTRTPVLMDFGSVGPLREDIETRRQVMNLIDQAAQHTTISYRPPELFEGGMRPEPGAVCDYTKVDVWSLGCSFFAVLYGASPSECEFARSNNGRLRIVDCTQLKVMGGIPKLPQGCAATSWYSQDTLKLIEQMLTQDRHQRPNVGQVIGVLESIIHKLGGRVVELEKTHDDLDDDENDDDLDSLLNSNRGFP